MTRLEAGAALRELAERCGLRLRSHHLPDDAEPARDAEREGGGGGGGAHEPRLLVGFWCVPALPRGVGHYETGSVDWVTLAEAVAGGGGLAGTLRAPRGAGLPLGVVPTEPIAEGVGADER